MCYLEFFRLHAAFGVQSNTFSFTYANFFAKNCSQDAHFGGICAKKNPFLRVFATSIMQIIMKKCSFSW